jgi:hypothetical protein
MSARLICLLLLWTFLAPAGQGFGATKDMPAPLDPSDSRLKFSFPVQPGSKPLRFTVNLDRKGTITGVSVFRQGKSKPFQTLPSCHVDPDRVNEYWDDYEVSMLIEHADLNFDGFADFELLQFYNAHLGKKLSCIFLWDSKAERFTYSKDLTKVAVNLKAHPKNKTLTTREDWQGGAWQDSTYRWKNGKLELIEQNSLLGDWSNSTDKECGFTYSCSRRIKGRMVDTLTKAVCAPDEMDHLPPCPSPTQITAEKKVRTGTNDNP